MNHDENRHLPTASGPQTPHDGDRDATTTVIVVGASRGLGRAIARTLAREGSTVIAVSRTEPTDTAGDVQGRLHVELADATDPTLPATLLARHDPDAVVIVAGATPDMRPLQDHTWQSFSAHWESEVRISFQWLGETLRRPLRRGGRVITVSSGAALAGSPLSGGYAGAKATQRFVAAYAAQESQRADLGLTFTTLMLQFAPQTAVGEAGVSAYAAAAGLSVEEYLARLPFPILTPEIAASAIGELLRAEPAAVEPVYLLNGAGLHPLDT